MTTIKKCGMCCIEKSTTEFYKRKTAFQSRCKKCDNEIRKKNNLLNNSFKKYYEKNKEKILLKNRLYAEKKRALKILDEEQDLIKRLEEIRVSKAIKQISV